MKCLDRLRRCASAMGAKIDEELLRQVGIITIDAPAGYVWDCTGTSSLAIPAENSGGQAWYAKAANDAEDDMRQGLRLADDEEREDIEWNIGEEWKACAGAPEKIEFPDSI